MNGFLDGSSSGPGGFQQSGGQSRYGQGRNEQSPYGRREDGMAGGLGINGRRQAAQAMRENEIRNKEQELAIEAARIKQKSEEARQLAIARALEERQRREQDEVKRQAEVAARRQEDEEKRRAAREYNARRAQEVSQFQQQASQRTLTQDFAQRRQGGDAMPQSIGTGFVSGSNPGTNVGSSTFGSNSGTAIPRSVGTSRTGSVNGDSAFGSPTSTTVTGSRRGFGGGRDSAMPQSIGRNVGPRSSNGQNTNGSGGSNMQGGFGSTSGQSNNFGSSGLGNAQNNNFGSGGLGNSGRNNNLGSNGLGNSGSNNNFGAGGLGNSGRNNNLGSGSLGNSGSNTNFGAGGLGNSGNSNFGGGGLGNNGRGGGLGQGGIGNGINGQSDRSSRLGDSSQSNSQQQQPNSLREAFGDEDNERKRRWEQEEARKREVVEAFKKREAEEELSRLQADVDSKRIEVDKFGERNGVNGGDYSQRMSGSSMRMAGEGVSTSRTRAEEAKRWIADETMKRGFDPLKVSDDVPYSIKAYQYQDEGYRGHDETSEYDRVRKIYLKWCRFYDKQSSDKRLSVFADNLYQAEDYAVSRGGRVQLSAFADLTRVEYRQRQEEAGRDIELDYWRPSQGRRRMSSKGGTLPPPTNGQRLATISRPRREASYSQWDEENPKMF